MFSERLLSLLTDRETRIVVLTGAGISKESGVPTFRDPDGLWAKFRPEELANMDAFLENTELVWSWYQHRRDLINKVQPNEGHFKLAEMEDFFEDFTLVTQNVDNLHQLAGSKNVLELHGNIQKSYCIDCGTDWNQEETGGLPTCHLCGGKIRPGVVWFGEMLPEEVLQAAITKATQADLVFSIGTAGVVFPAASIPLIGIENGAYGVEINPSDTEISSYFQECVRSPSAVCLNQLALQ